MTNRINRHKEELETNLQTCNEIVKIGRKKALTNKAVVSLRCATILTRREEKSEIRNKTQNKEERKKFIVLGISTMNTDQRVCHGGG